MCTSEAPCDVKLIGNPNRPCRNVHRADEFPVQEGGKQACLIDV